MLNLMKTINYPFYFYGSENSLDKDVIISIPRYKMPTTQEERKRFIKVLENEVHSENNIKINGNLVVIENGNIADTIYPKSWTDSLNNALLDTYKYHKQVYPNPIKSKLKRNKLLSIYKCIRTVMSLLARTNYREDLKPHIKGLHPFKNKINGLKKVNFLNLTNFNQRNMSDVDIWKTISFYLGQNILLVADNIEVYTKRDLLFFFPEMENFINRKTITNEDKIYLNNILNEWLILIKDFGKYKQCKYIMECNNEVIDTKNETIIK